MENLLKIDASALSHVGMVCAANSDNFYINGRYIQDYETNDIQVSIETVGKEHLFAVTDSMDEGIDDKSNSISAVREIKKQHEKIKASSKDIEYKAGLIKDTVEETSNLIHSLILGSNEEVTKKPSLSGLLLSGSRAAVLCIGSCRAYLYRNGTIRQLVTDSKRAERLLKMGILTNDQAQVLTGSRDETTKEYKKLEVFSLNKGDVFLLCSNGIADCLEEEALFDIISLEQDASSLSRIIMKETVRSGADDCATVLVLKVLEVPGQPDVVGEEADEEEEEKTPLPFKSPLDKDMIEPGPRKQAMTRSQAAKKPNISAARRNLAIKRYISTAASILIIALLIFGVYKLWTGYNAKKAAPVDASVGGTQETGGLDIGTTEPSASEPLVEQTDETTSQADTAITEEQETTTASETEKTPQTPVEGEKYTVKKGDSLFIIAQKFYGDERKYTLIMDANGIKNADMIQADQVLIIPPLPKE